VTSYITLETAVASQADSQFSWTGLTGYSGLLVLGKAKIASLLGQD
jgi:hypothetical protein